MINNIDLKLSSQKALWGHVTKNLVSVSAEEKNDIIYFKCVFDKNFSKKDKEILSEAATELIADFSDCKIEEKYISIKEHDKIDNLENLLYLRYENKF